MRPVDRLSQAAGVLAALGYPVRAAILEAISIEPLCVCELGALLGMSSPAPNSLSADAEVLLHARQGRGWVGVDNAQRILSLLDDRH